MEQEHGEAEGAARPAVVSGYDRLRAARENLEDALVAPKADSGAWCRRLAEAAGVLQAAIDRHREVSEAPGGTLEQAVARRPGLARAAARLRGEHPALLSEASAVREALLAFPAGKGPPKALQLRAVRLLDSLRNHTAQGSDLLYEAFNREDGGEG